jgi:TPR repeat protein
MPSFPKKLILMMVALALQLPLHAQDAMITLKHQAGQGNADAQYRLGLDYASGNGAPKDAVAAVEWHRKAAEQGHAEAQFSLGEAYINGEGVEKDALEGYAYLNLAGVTLEKARAARDKLEESLTKDLILGGQRRTKEMKERLRKVAEENERLRKVAEENERLRKVAEENERLRKVAEENERLRKVAEENERLRKVAEENERLRKVAEENERLRKVAEENERLRKVAEENERIRKVAEENERIRNANEKFISVVDDAKKGDSFALRELARCFRDGDGVKKDVVAAYALYSHLGDFYSRDLIAKQMTPKQISDGKQRTKELQKDFGGN